MLRRSAVIRVTWISGVCVAKRDVAYQSDVWHSQCCGSGSVCFWASRIR
jgi:hypothetical protein